MENPSQTTHTPATYRRDLGRSGEDAAARHLESLGWQVLERNWRCREGEIDLIAADGATVVIVEVKTRQSTRYGRAIEAVTPTKLARLRGLGARWAAERDVRCASLRIDVVGLERVNGTWQVDHRRGVQP